MIKTFRNLLALILMVLIIGMWVMQGLSLISPPEVIVGASISIATLVAQFYFRKASTTTEN